MTHKVVGGGKLNLAAISEDKGEVTSWKVGEAFNKTKKGTDLLQSFEKRKYLHRSFSHSNLPHEKHRTNEVFGDSIGGSSFIIHTRKKNHKSSPLLGRKHSEEKIHTTKSHSKNTSPREFKGETEVFETSKSGHKVKEGKKTPRGSKIRGREQSKTSRGSEISGRPKEGKKTPRKEKGQLDELIDLTQVEQVDHFNDWKIKVKAEVIHITMRETAFYLQENASNKPNKKFFTSIVKRVFAESLKHTTIPDNLKNIFEPLNNHEKDEKLIALTKCTNPVKFLKSYSTIEALEMKIEKARVILQDKDLLEKIVGNAKTIRSELRDVSSKTFITEKFKWFNSFEKTFSKGFGNQFGVPVAFISPIAIKETLLAYINSDFKKRESHFSFNDVKLPFPYNVKFNKPYASLEELIEHMQQTFWKDTSVNLSKELRFIGSDNIMKILENLDEESYKLSRIYDNDFRFELIDKCKKLFDLIFSSDCGQSVNNLNNMASNLFISICNKERIQENDLENDNTINAADAFFIAKICAHGKKFWGWLQAQSSFAQEEWDELARYVVDILYPLLLVMPKMATECPYFFLFQSLTDQAYKKADDWIRHELFPECGIDGLRRHTLLSNADATNYSLKLSNNGDFEVEQLKGYDLAFVDSENKRHPEGLLKIAWTIRGNLSSYARQGQFKVVEFSFLEGISLAKQAKVMGCYFYKAKKGHPKSKDSSKKHVSKEKKRTK